MLSPDNSLSYPLNVFAKPNTDTASEWGRVWLVGAGPGDPELITVAGLKLIKNADVAVYDRLGAPALLSECRPDAINVNGAQSSGRHAIAQPGINALMAQHAMAGRNVVRLKGGDPFIFGRGGEEMVMLRSLGIQVDIVPGVTAASACAAATGIPLTHRGLASEVSLITAHHRENGPGCDWAKLAGQRDRTLVFYMGLSQAQEISEGLVRNGLPSTTPVALISNGGTADQRTVRCTLETLPWAALSNSVVSPCLIVVGAVVNLAHPHSAVRYRRQEPARWAA